MVLLRPVLNTVARVMLLEHVISSHYPAYNLPLASHFPWTKSLIIMVYKDHHLAFVLLPSIWNVLCSDSPYSCTPKSLPVMSSQLPSKLPASLSSIFHSLASPAPFTWFTFLCSTHHHLMFVLVTKSYLTLCNSMDCSPPGSSIYGILQARILEWVAIPFFRGFSWPRYQTWVSHTTGRFFMIWATRKVYIVSIYLGIVCLFPLDLLLLQLTFLFVHCCSLSPLNSASTVNSRHSMDVYGKKEGMNEITN